MSERRPIRSALWARADGAQAMEDAANTAADAIYLDLESSVGKAELPQARFWPTRSSPKALNSRTRSTHVG